MDPLETFLKKSLKAEKNGSLIVPKKVERGPFCFGMVLYFKRLWMRSELSTKYLWEKCAVHKKWTDRVELTKKLATVRVFKNAD